MPTNRELSVYLKEEWEMAMKFASREGATARTLAVTAPGWYAGEARNSAAAASTQPMKRMHRNGAEPSNKTHDRQSSGLAKASTIVFHRGQEIFGPGTGEGLVYIVRTGCIRLFKSLPDGRAINLGLLGPNTVFTQESNAEGLSTGSTAEAIVESSVSIVGADDLAELIQRTPELAHAVVHGMTRRISELHVLTEQLLARDTSVRLASTLLQLSRGFGRPTADGLTAITLPVTHQSLANMIGSNRVTVTRKLLELQEQGAVRSLGRNAIAVDPRRLLSHAQSATASVEAQDDDHST
jgi:CRP/FNR family transcriptional regulator